MEWVDGGVIDPASETDVYTKGHHYTIDYSKAAGQGWTYTGFTQNRTKYPQDPRLSLYTQTVGAPWVYTIGGQKIMFLTDMYSSTLSYYRKNSSTDGECWIPSGLFSQSNIAAEAGGFAGWPLNQPASGEWIWRDANGNGAMDSGEYVSNGTLSTSIWGWCVDASGNVWQAGQSGLIREFPYQGLDSYNNPIYNYTSMKTVTTTYPAPFNELDRLYYDSVNDVMYLTGYSATYPNPGDWKLIGKVLARYNSWSTGNRTAAWTTALSYSSSSGNSCAKPVSMWVAGDYVFTVDADPPVIRVYRQLDGVFLDTISPLNSPELGNDAWNNMCNDMPFSINAYRRSNGEYIICSEDGGNAKVDMYRWPSVATPSFSPAPGSYSSAQSVTITCGTSGATIRYTTNGSIPNSTSTQYTAAIPISSTTTLKAKAFYTGMADSLVASGVYTISQQQVATPTFTPSAGSYGSAQTVTISCSTSGATIHYTIDGSTPTSTSPTYANAFGVSSTTTVKAIGILSGDTNSNVASATYTITVTGSTRYEAENAALYNDGTYSDAVASNGQGVSWIEATGSTVTFTVTASTTGVFQMNVRYCAPNNATQTVYVNGSSAGQISYTSTGSNRSAPYATATMNLTLNAGSNTVMFEKTASDTNYACLDCIDLLLTGAPNMSITGNGGIAITNGSTTPSTSNGTDFGPTTVTSGSVSQTYTIKNSGTAILNLTGNPLVSISGTNAADFSVTTQPSSTVAMSGGTTTFVVKFVPSSQGLRTAKISISNNDSAHNPYTFSIQGNGWYEAENAALLGDGTYSDAAASNSAGVSWIENTGCAVTFTVSVPTTKTYTMTVRYCAPSNATQTVFVNGVSVGQISYTSTGSNRSAPYALATMNVNLSAGSNTIMLEKTANDANYACLDCMTVQ
jgi:hypothetical protein